MIRTCLLEPGKALQQGGIELMQRWQQNADALLWLDLQDESIATETALLDALNCHELAIAEAQSKRRPPKVEAFENHLMIIYRGVSSMNDELDFQPVDISLFINERCLITRHKGESSSIEYWLGNQAAVADLILEPANLAIAIIHYSFGRYLEGLLEFEGNLSDIEDQMQLGGNDEILRALVLYKARLRRLNRVFRYHERVIGQLVNQSLPFFDRDSEYLRHSTRNLYDRCERLHSLGQMYYEICGDLIEGYLSFTSHQLNHTMKILTIITAVFVPLSFMAGLYGMNFDNMPELHHPNAYYILLAVMSVTAVSLIVLFKRRGWL